MLRVVHLSLLFSFQCPSLPSSEKRPLSGAARLVYHIPNYLSRGFCKKFRLFFVASPAPLAAYCILSRFTHFVKRIFKLSALFLQKNPHPAGISSKRRRYPHADPPRTRNATLYNMRSRAATPHGTPDRRAPSQRRRFSPKLCILYKSTMENSAYLNPCKPVAIPGGIRYNIKGIHATIKKGTRTIWQQSK